MVTFPEAFLLTFLIETILLFLLLRKLYPAKQIIKNSLAANALTHPVVWFVFPFLAFLLGFGYLLQTIFSEMFAFVVETGVYASLFQDMKLRQAALLSFACNAASFLAGLLLTYLF